MVSYTQIVVSGGFLWRTSEHSGAREQSELGGVRERESGASERANGQASGPVIQSGFLVDLGHSALADLTISKQSWALKRRLTAEQIS